jgi:hypothetical protein
VMYCRICTVSATFISRWLLPSCCQGWCFHWSPRHWQSQNEGRYCSPNWDHKVSVN